MTIPQEILDQVRAHAAREGRNDYLGRFADFDAGSQPRSWVWPFCGADAEYINAVGISTICKQLGLAAERWDEIAAEWCAAFEDAYVAEGMSP